MGHKPALEYKPGEIIFADANGNYSPFGSTSCFGVVIDRDFWFKKAEEEALYWTDFQKKIKSGHPADGQVLFRVLGTKVFNRYHLVNDSASLEPAPCSVIHYYSQREDYVNPINLKPLIEIAKVEGGRTANVLLSIDAFDCLNDASVVYGYLDGERCDGSKAYLHRRDKLLRLLESAIPQL